MSDNNLCDLMAKMLKYVTIGESIMYILRGDKFWGKWLACGDHRVVGYTVIKLKMITSEQDFTRKETANFFGNK